MPIRNNLTFLRSFFLRACLCDCTIKLDLGGSFLTRHRKFWHFYSIWHTVLRLIRSSGSNLMLTINVGLLMRWGAAGGLSARCAVYVRVTSADLSQAARCPVCWRRQVTLAGCCQITCKAAVQCYSCSASSLLAACCLRLCLQLHRCGGFLSHNY